ncbi:VOC family protein [Thermodesulfobacteriota bacterium]
MDKEKKASTLEIGHIALVVSDMDKAIGFLSSLGAEFSPPKPFGNKHKTTLRGETVEWKVDICHGKIGKIGLELFQPTGEGTPYKEFLDRTGGGIHHISFDDIDDLENERANMETGGARVISSASSKTEYVAHYLEADALPGVIIEIKKK